MHPKPHPEPHQNIRPSLGRPPLWLSVALTIAAALALSLAIHGAAAPSAPAGSSRPLAAASRLIPHDAQWREHDLMAVKDAANLGILGEQPASPHIHSMKHHRLLHTSD